VGGQEAGGERTSVFVTYIFDGNLKPLLYHRGSVIGREYNSFLLPYLPLFGERGWVKINKKSWNSPFSILQHGFNINLG